MKKTTNKPHRLPQVETDKYPKNTMGSNVKWTKFSSINDDKLITEKEREQRLQEYAKLNGFEFQFVTKSVE